LSNLAQTYGQQGKLTKAAKMYEEVLAKRKAILGDDHPDTRLRMDNLAETSRKLTEAAKRDDKVVSTTRMAIWGDDHPYALTTIKEQALDLNLLRAVEKYPDDSEFQQSLDDACKSNPSAFCISVIVKHRRPLSGLKFSPNSVINHHTAPKTFRRTFVVSLAFRSATSRPIVQKKKDLQR